MAKTKKLLLTTFVAIICLVALTLGIMLPTATPAHAATYEYVKSDSAKIPAADAALIVHQYGGKYYAMTATSSNSSLTVTEVTLKDGNTKIDTSATTVTANLLWKIKDVGGNNVEIESPAFTSDNKLYAPNNISLGGSATTLDGSSNQLYAPNDYNVVGSSTGYTMVYGGSTTFMIFVQQEATGGGDETLSITRYKKSALPTEENVTKTGLLVATIDGSNYALTMGTKDTTSVSFNGAQAIVLDGDYVSQISEDRNNHSKLIAAQDLPGWFTWNITKTATGYTIQTNIETSIKSNYAYLKASSGFFTQSDKIEPALKMGADNSFAFDKVLAYGTTYSYLMINSGKNQFAHTYTETYVYFTFYEAETKTPSSTHNVTFANGNASATGTMNAVAAPEGSYVLPACGYTLTDYTFAGWKVGDSEDVKAVGETIELTEDVTLTATWSYKYWQVTFTMDDKADVLRQAEKGKDYTMPKFEEVFSTGDLPSGKVFVNWEDADGTLYTSGTKYQFTKDVTLTPVFANAVHITFDANGGTLKSTYADGDNAPENSEYSLPTAATRSGYTLKGYICSADGQYYKTGVKYQLGTEAVTFTAQWKYDGYVLTVKVEGQEDQEVLIAESWGNEYENTTYTINFNDPVVEGKVFDGWAFNGDTDNLRKKGYIITTAQLQSLTDGEGELVAVFRNPYTYTVTLHYGSQTDEVQYVEGTTNILFDAALFNAHFTLENSESQFNGWYKDATFTQSMTTSYVTAGKGELTADMDLYAKVSEKVTVNFNYGIDGVAVRTSTESIDPGVPAPYPYPSSELPEKQGYTLVGWSKTQGGEIDYNAAANVYIRENCTLYAVWSYNYNVITLTNGLTGNAKVEEEILVLKKDVYLGANTFTLASLLSRKNGDGEDAKTYAELFAVEHKTITWKDASNEAVRLDDEITNNGDKTFTAVYADTMYTITFEVNGGEPVNAITAKFGAAITLPTPERTGYLFVGWMDKNSQQYTSTTMPGENITLTAGWVAAHTITFNSNGGSTVATLTYATGATINLPAAPTKLGYTFVKWQKDGADFTATEMPDEDITLDAVWQMDTAAFAAKLAAISSATTIAAKRAAILEADALLAIWTAAGEDVSMLDTTTLTAVKSDYNAMAADAASDLQVAEKVATSLVATIGGAVALAAVALILKRRMF